MKKLVGYIVFILLMLNSIAQADGECYRHSECDNDDLCINTVCTAPESDLLECETDDGCDPDAHFATLCYNGFCKKEGVYCENSAGSCYYESTKTSCSCRTGEGMASASVGTEEGADSGGSSEPSYTDEELYSMCQDDLARSCGTEEPDIRDECSDEQLEKCTEYLEHEQAIVLACDEESEPENEEIGYFQLASCCRHIDDEDYQKQYDCIMDLESDDCDGFEECLPDDVMKGEATIGTNDGPSAGGESSADEPSDPEDGWGASDSDADTEDEEVAGDNDDANDEGEEDDEENKTEKDDDDSGCSVATIGSSSNNSGKGLVFLLGLTLAAITYRRKRQ